MWWFGVDKPARKQAQYDEPIAVHADQQTLRRAAHDHPHHRGTDDDGPAQDHTHHRGTDDDGPAHDLERRIDLDHDCGRNTVGFLDVIDTLGLDRGRNRSRCRPDRWPRPATACTVSPSSGGDLETGRQTGIAAGDDGP
jgi:hypothetical protein